MKKTTKKALYISQIEVKMNWLMHQSRIVPEFNSINDLPILDRIKKELIMDINIDEISPKNKFEFDVKYAIINKLLKADLADYINYVNTNLEESENNKLIMALTIRKYIFELNNGLNLINEHGNNRVIDVINSVYLDISRKIPSLKIEREDDLFALYVNSLRMDKSDYPIEAYIYEGLFGIKIINDLVVKLLYENVKPHVMEDCFYELGNQLQKSMNNISFSTFISFLDTCNSNFNELYKYYSNKGILKRELK